MQKKIFSFSRIYILILLPFLLINVGCSTTSKLNSAANKYYQGEYSRASQIYYTVLKKDQFNLEAIIGLGKSNFRQKNYSAAKRYLAAAINDFDRNKYQCSTLWDEALYMLGESYFQLNENEAAYLTFKKIIDLCEYSSHYQSALFQGGQCAYLLGIQNFNASNWSKGIRYLNEALNYFSKQTKLFDRSDKIYYALAQSYIKQENYTKGIQFFQLIIDKYSNSEFYSKAKHGIQIAYYNQALTKYEDKKFKQAIANLNILKALDSPLFMKPEGQYIWGRSFEQTRAYDKALKVLLKLQSSSAINQSQLLGAIANCRYNIGEQHFRNSKYDVALTFFSKAQPYLKNREQQGNLLFFIGQIYESKQNYQLAIEKYKRINSSYRKTKYHQSACLKGLGIAKKLNRIDDAIGFLVSLNTISPSDDYIFQLASLHGKKNNRNASLANLLKLYDSYSYNSYRRRVRNNLEDFTCLAQNEAFYRWLRGIRRLKLSIKEAYCRDSDALGANDLFVIVSSGREVLLCTEEFKDNNRPRFTQNEMVVDVTNGSQVVLTLMEKDIIADDQYIQEVIPLKPGKNRVRNRKGDYIEYEITDSKSRLYSDKTEVPKNFTVTQLLVGAALGYAAISTANNDTSVGRFLSCLTQAGASRQVKDPFAAALVSEAIDKIEKRKGFSISNLAQNTALNLIVSELNSNGHSDLALLVEAGGFLSCIFGE